ncbi:MAG: DNA polymerase III subunit alpha [Alphaproteobacteria bacterium]
MARADFIHLRAHSAYSLSEGAIAVSDLVRLARKHAMPAVAMTDTNNLFGAMEFSLKAAEAGIQPIIGCIIGLARDDTPGPVRHGNGAGNGHDAEPDPFVLLAQSAEGYGNLLALVSDAYLESEAGMTPRVGWAGLEQHSEGLIAFTGGLDGPVSRRLLEGQSDAARQTMERLAATFTGRLYVELQRHGRPGEAVAEPGLLQLAYDLDLPLVATNDVHFADASMYEASDALLCINQGVTLSRQDRRRLTPEHGFKSANEMRALFSDLPEAVDNTVAIARRCAFMLEPRDPILPPYDAGDGSSEAEALRRMAAEGLEQRLGLLVWTPDMDAAAREVVAAPYRERLAYELDVIVDMGFAGYFLIVADFIRWARTNGIPVGPGRGSGAGSVAAWSLTITDLDPLRFGLLFERFLNPHRVSMPDFDIDFCQDRRDDVIRYVQQRYGADRVAQIITFGTLQARAALRDVGRVLELPYGQVDRIAKLVPYNPANPVSLTQAIANEPQLQAMRDEDEAVARLLDISLRLEGMYRHASTHAAGVVIGDRPLKELVPLYRDPRSPMPVTQFSMKYVEVAGLVKFDFLGLTTLTVLKHATDLISRRGEDVDLLRIPLDDKRAFQMMSRGDTVGIFQFESSGMRNLLREAGVNNLEDIIALVALYRPGPMENIPKYVACKHGREEPEFLHETIEPVVADTYGVIIYQEQVMQIAQVFAGFSLGQADLLRRAMGKKIKSEMDAQRETFIEGAVARGVDGARARYVFDLVDKFAGYGFNKAHSAGYGLIAYQTAWLKANYPLEFFAATMTLSLGNTDKLAVYRQELSRLGIPLLPPDINSSAETFTVEYDTSGGGAIRYALGAIKGVGQTAMAALVAERDANGAYTDVFDLARRAGATALNKRQLEGLIKAGALDGLEANRARCLAAVDILLREASAAGRSGDDRQVGLFDDSDVLPANTPVLPEAPDWSEMDRLAREFEAIGFYLSAHPLDAYDGTPALARAVSSGVLRERLESGPSAARMTLAGTVIGRQERTSSRGNRFAFVQLSDQAGIYEVLFFAEPLNQYRELLEAGRPLLLTVDARLEQDEVRLSAQSVTLLDSTPGASASALRVYLDCPDPLSSLSSVIARYPVGNGRIYLVVKGVGREVEIELPGAYTLGAAARASLKSLPGVRDVQFG